jgi:hypothetical protein
MYLGLDDQALVLHQQVTFPTFYFEGEGAWKGRTCVCALSPPAGQGRHIGLPLQVTPPPLGEGPGVRANTPPRATQRPGWRSAQRRRLPALPGDR